MQLTCPVCAEEPTERFSVAGFPIFACGQCSHQFASFIPGDDHVGKQFSDAYFFGGGTAGYQNYLTNAGLVERSARRYTRIISQHCRLSDGSSSIRVLDVGCAAGFVMQGFRQAGWIPTGIDPNQTMVEQSQARGFNARRATLETYFDETSHTKQTDKPFDLVSMIQVIAHLSDISRATDNLYRLVRDDGYVLVETWNSASLTAKLLGRNWHEYSPPNVLHFFSKQSLDRLLTDAGFRVVAGGRPAKRINIGHARSLFDFKYGNSRWAKALIKSSQFVPDEVSVPYPAEDLFWRIYQKQGGKDLRR